MLYRLCAPIEGGSLVAPRAEIMLPDGISCGLVREPIDNRLSLFAQTRVREFISFLPTMTRGADGIPVLNIPKNPVRISLIEVLQYTEALGSFLLGIQKIDWENPVEVWIPESNEDERVLQIRHFRRREEPHPALGGLSSSDTLDSILRSYDRWRHLSLPFTLLRNGRLAYQQLRYVESFFYNYLFLEGAFARGKSKTYQTLNEFYKARPVILAAQQAVLNLRSDHSGYHVGRVQALLAEYGCDLSAEGLIRLVVKARGTIFHHSPQTRRGIVDPNSRRDYHTIAFLAMTLAVLSSILLLHPGEEDYIRLIRNG